MRRAFQQQVVISGSGTVYSSEDLGVPHGIFLTGYAARLDPDDDGGGSATGEILIGSEDATGIDASTTREDLAVDSGSLSFGAGSATEPFKRATFAQPQPTGELTADNTLQAAVNVTSGSGDWTVYLTLFGFMEA